MLPINQEFLLKQIKAIFPGDPTFVNARKKSNLKYETTGGYMEFDIWIPKYDICFEFQDPYHFTTTWYYQRPQSKIGGEDNVKMETAHRKGMSLIQIPCWWHGSQEGLMATIKFHRPDLMQKSKLAPIPLNPPFGFFQGAEIPEIGELMLASFPVAKFNISRFSKTWWMGEKYDGIRCCWDSKSCAIFTRNGNELTLLPRFTFQLPKSSVDGEFWFGRGRFSFTYALFNDLSDSVRWHQLRLVCFDNPSIDMWNAPFEERYAILLSSISAESAFNIIAARVMCENTAHISLFAHSITDSRGEGVILRKMRSLYEHGRNHSLVKLKTTQSDKEAFVVGVDHEAVHLKLPEGQEFSIPMEDVRIRKPSVGDVVSFTFESYARRDVPARPTIYRIRTDVSWEDVVHNFYQETKYLNSYWSNIENRRQLFESYASENGFDHTVAKNWYSQSREKILSFKGARSVVPYHNNDLSKTLLDLFPNIGLEKSKFRGTYLESSMEVRRSFFLSYADEHRFDPLVAKNWYLQSKEKILAHTGASTVMLYYNNSVSRALKDVFPNIGLKKSKLLDRFLWYNVENRRKFFEKYARQNGFDHSVAENWYAQSREKIMAVKGANSIINYHKQDLSKALMDLFPNIGLQKSKFQGPYLVHDISVSKNFFTNFADENGFDPLNANNWYMQVKEKIMSAKGASTIMLHYNRSLSKALTNVFPNIGLQKAKFNDRFVWSNEENRRKFFERYAKVNGFDPLVVENWLPYSTEQIKASKGGTGVLQYHNDTISTALSDLFGFDSAHLNA
eukprot:Phypoly_transcript_02511.p1 GENE.Phypoly_transcript_02511~~Phypoly_transcript_02511.p1  ORF type:complete len:789 (+),score=87.01 Phypoly_transcript_02511:70-2436(+)